MIMETKIKRKPHKFLKGLFSHQQEIKLLYRGENETGFTAFCLKIDITKASQFKIAANRNVLPSRY